MPSTVMIVEDEANLAELLTDILESSGYDVVLTTGRHASTRAQEIKPAAIVLDFRMPGMNGAEVVEDIRLHLGDRTPPIMLVSGLANVQQLASESGAQAFLRKPFDIGQFIDTVERLVEGAGASHS